MSITRLYTGPDGQSHLEELDLASHPEITTLLATKGIVFRSAQPGHFSDWHNAPRRQFVITVSGEAEIGLGRKKRKRTCRRANFALAVPENGAAAIT